MIQTAHSGPIASVTRSDRDRMHAGGAVRWPMVVLAAPP